MAIPTSEQLDQCERELLARLRQVYGDNKWIVSGGVAQGIDGGVQILRKLGAKDAIGVACRIGVGELSEDVRFIISNDPHVGEDASMVERIHDNDRELHDLPEWVISEIDEWDPDQAAKVIVQFTMGGAPIAGRSTFGARKPEWAALEDKIAIRQIWESAAIDTAPDQVVAVTDAEALLAAHRELATRWGTVWAVDNEQGWHGGGQGTYWVQSEERARELMDELAGSHHRVRIQPFLEGVPCSVHGMVLADATLAFRPCEMLVLLDIEESRFEYCRAATFWDPSPSERDDMRAVARSIGDALRDHVDFRGVFTVDGVLTRDGFRPTEVNPRFGAALPPRLPTSDGEQLPLFFAHLAGVEGHLDDFDAEVLEALLLDRLDQGRYGSCLMFTSMSPGDKERSVAVAATWTGTKFVDLRAIAPDDEASVPIARANWGQNPGGGLIFAHFTDDMPIGPAVAPTAAALRNFFIDHWDLDLPPLRPAFG